MADETPHVERRWCGLGNHKLRTPYRVLRNPHLLKFGQRINSELRSQPLCLSCYRALERLYNLKNNNAKMHAERRRRAAAANSSTLTSTETKGSSSTVNAANVPPSSGRSSSQDGGPTTSAAAAAKRARTQLEAPVASESTETPFDDDDDDPNSNLSLNAVNGTRLPHIQPIPRRRQFVHLNKKAMDIYLAGTTGG
ncbi:uncharacterized protein LOC128265987 [Drosophila gunungcola]|uniref:Ms(3)K81 n=1 Tax=Drosophila gunungcola TaxID=103775 RepID=A0A9P9Y9X4_9MUSC|nr:uncharacterized protein LOC128265987 [Drosophila gunungcola]KAI8033087.1 hypothetical protein M5D96_014151 [Drosophila gunungcola]